ncbi:bifunctional UDP-N-acetylglucosamine diphosphorylase/glucosamine-1-phosphate N-acetyltransferase GlmU [Anaerorhabdus furcosa]|uniref:Bifunctional protein GlmU n=1 Tax=Anaerorhabdus furcosa TaxID=118967 RepID=A0A1T4MRT5_9FIRM|nr:bifunctional UDP-N-acetylglucosamine diphosphorylase/glucosamine-1-phosphate N-acetyltransferase GlmU [Anaerorhabdus furcosa]SJZ69769.1 bifunctional UDP-N-acetylglucosamine pyrophosphorylase / Glucosamine-1-phosphate N-acetyltransferase [Anaerorhabdus furcosa]
MRQAIIMAAGKGTRMMSELPKVMHKVCQKTMVEHLIDQSKLAGATRVVTVVGYGHEVIEEAMKGKTDFALQEPQLGTGHAVMQAKQCASEDGETLVINGDCPCLTNETLSTLALELKDNTKMVILTAILDDPSAYGRVIRDENGYVTKIVEFKDCTEEEKKIKEINTGIYAFDNKTLFSNLTEIQNNNAQSEYYITDLVAILNNKGIKVSAVVATDNDEVAGVNDKVELAYANHTMQQRINSNWMRKGVTLINPDATYIGAEVEIEADTTIYPNVYLEGKTKIAKGTVILPNSFLVDARIGERCTIDSSRITDSEVKDDCTVGPYAHLRMHTVVDSKNRIGNFVEFKNTNFGYDSRCAHLTYIGDSDIGSKVNIGCGVVTVNYDGKNKFRTVVKDGAFIGSNVNLIAPVTVGENAVVAAGSTATKDVPDGDMAIARCRQENKPGYGTKYKNK